MSIIHYNIDGIEIEFSIPYIRIRDVFEATEEILSIRDYLEYEDDWMCQWGCCSLEFVLIPKYISLEYMSPKVFSFNYPRGISYETL